MLEDIITEMKALEEKEVGYVKKLTRAQTVFYKPLPVEENKDTIVGVMGTDHWDTYTQNFKEIDTMHITVSQHNWMLQNEEELGISSRPTASS